MSCCGGSKPTIIVTSAPEPAFLTPDQIVSAADIVAGYDASDLVNGAIALWPDRSGNGFDLAQATGANQPVAADNGPNGNRSVLFDGIDDFMANAALNLPAPGTTPTVYWSVLRQITWTNGNRFWDNSGDNLTVAQQSASPSVFMFNGIGGPLNSALILNTYKRLVAAFSNSASDYLQVGTTTVTGVATGNNDPPATFVLGAANVVPALNSNIEVCELWIFSVFPTALQLAQLDSYATVRYGVSVVS